MHRFLISLWLVAMILACPAASGAADDDAIEANPARPTVSNPATLVPVGYLQFETGVLVAGISPEFSARYSLNEVVKLAVTSRLQFFAASESFIYSRVGTVNANDTGGFSGGAQLVLLQGEGAKPTLAFSYAFPPNQGGGTDLDLGSPRNSSILYASADVRGFHYDANAVFNEVIDQPRDIHRLQFGQTLSVSHPLGKGFGLSGEVWRFTQPFLRSNAVGNLWALSYSVRPNLVLDAGFNRGLTSTSTRWEGFAGFTYLLPHRLWRK